MSAHTFERVSFKNTKEFGLHLRAHFTDLVEHQSATIGRFKFSTFPFGGTSESPLFVTKQFTFQKRW